MITHGSTSFLGRSIRSLPVDVKVNTEHGARAGQVFHHVQKDRQGARA